MQKTLWEKGLMCFQTFWLLPCSSRSSFLNHYLLLWSQLSEGFCWTVNRWTVGLTHLRWIRSCVGKDSSSSEAHETAIEKRNNSFNEFCCNFSKSKWAKWIHFQPQHYFCCDKKNDILIDFIGKHENFNNDFGKICEKIGIEKLMMRLAQLIDTPELRALTHEVKYRTLTS